MPRGRCGRKGQGLPAHRSTWRDAIEYSAFRAVVAVFAALPLEPSAALSGWLWRKVARLTPRHARALDHLALAFPEMGPAEREQIADEMWDNLGRTFAEFPHMQRIFADRRVETVGLEAAREALARGPFVLCGLHMSNWELLAGAAVASGVPIVGVYQSVNNRLVDEWVRGKRLPFYAGGLFKKSREAAVKLMRATQRDACPAFLGDLREGKGVAVPFFGRLASSTPVPATIARVRGLPLFAARVLRKPGETFEVRLTPVEVPHTDDREADIAVGTANLQAQFEAFIREAPEQWTWAHRRWD